MARHRRKASKRAMGVGNPPGTGSAALIAQREKLRAGQEFLTRNFRAADKLCVDLQHDIDKHLADGARKLATVPRAARGKCENEQAQRCR